MLYSLRRKNTMAVHSLHDLFVEELRDLLSAEQQIIKALPKMAKAASSDELRNAFEEHLEQTQQHVERLEHVFEHLGLKAKAKKCVAVEGIIIEGKDLMNKDLEPSIMDAGLIGGAQKVEHYEMAGYGTVRTWAQLMGYQEAADLLQQTLNEEKETDRKLTELAEHAINLEAVGAVP
jgi:ferritin-like metal-binding protein YciE